MFLLNCRWRLELRGALCLAVATCVAPTGQAHGDQHIVGGAQAPIPDIEEIIVTATLRADTTVQQLPASIAVLDQATIRSAAIQHFEELTALVPNLNFSGEGSRARYFQIRGTGELEQYEGAPNAAVGFIIDDIDFSALGGVATTFDTERIEVLRGPQGTRYGANALAGLIYVQSAAPPDQPEAYTEALAGSDGAWSLGAAAGGPVPGLGDQLSYRVAIQQYASDGFRNNAYLGRDDTYNRDELTARGKLRWRPAPGWQVDLTGMFVDIDNGYDAWANNNTFTTESDQPGKDSQRTSAGSLRVTGALNDAVTLVSITGVADSAIVFSFDADWGNPPGWAPDVYAFTERTDRDRRTINQELRLVSGPSGRLFGRGDWVLGAYALDLEESNSVTDVGVSDVNDAYCDDTPGLPEGYCDPYELDGTLASHYDATSLALFGQVEWPFNEATRLTVGLRGERRDAHYRATTTDHLVGGAVGGAQAPIPLNPFSPVDRLWGGELALTHDLTPQATAYARLARGYRAGGFNPSLDRVAPNDDQVQYGPESMWSYEAGLRLRGATAPWWADVNLFWQQRDDMQVKVPLQFQVGDPSTFIFITDNASSGRAYGTEVAGGWAFTDTLSLQASIALLDTEILRFNNETCPGGAPLPDAPPCFEGHPFPHAPPVSFAVTGLYERPDGWFSRVDFTGKGAFYFDYDTSTGADRKSSPEQVVNLRAGRQWTHWRAELWVRNLFDENYAVRGFYFGNEPPAFTPTRYIRLGDPRQIGVTLTWKM